MGNQVKIVFVGEDQNLLATIDRINNSMDRVGEVSRRNGRDFDQTFAVFRGNLLVDFFERSLKSAVNFGKGAVAAFNEVNAAQQGLAAVAKFQGIGGDTSQIVRNLDLVKNGLLGIGDASTALKNLLASGFNLEQSVELLKRFGDSAAFNRQASLSFGQAVASATEGIKNQNSVLVDNAGVTKNLSVILKERGFQMQDLSDKVKGAAARESLYQGLLVETQAQVGNASQLSGTFAGKLAQLEASYTKLEVAAGALITKNKSFNQTIDGATQAVDKFATALEDSNSGAHQLFDNLISDVSVAAQEVASLIGLVTDLIDKLSGGSKDGSSSIFKFGLFGDTSPVTQTRKLAEAQQEGRNPEGLGFFGPGGRLDRLIAGITPQGTVKSVDLLEARVAAAREALERSLNTAASGALFGAISNVGAPTTGLSGDAVTKALEAKAKRFDDSAKQSAESSKKFQEQIHSLNETFDELQSKLDQDNPFLRLFRDAEKEMDQFYREFGNLADGVISKLEELQKRRLFGDLFKEEIASLERINQLTVRRIELQNSTAFEDAERKRNQDFGQRQASLETEIKELERGSRFDEVEKAVESVRRLAATPGLVSGELSKAVEEATRGLSIEQLRQGGLLLTRRDALVDIGINERLAQFDKKRPAEVAGAEKFLNEAQQQFDLAKKKASIDPEFAKLFNERQSQEILDRSTIAVLSRISPDKLTPDLRNRELDATKRQIEYEVQQRAAVEAIIEKFGLSVTKFDQATEKSSQAATELGKQIEKGIGVDVSIKDSPTTQSEVTGQEPTPSNSKIPFIGGRGSLSNN